MADVKSEKSEIELAMEQLGSLEAINNYFERKHFSERMAEHDRVSRIYDARERAKQEVQYEIAQRMLEDNMPIELIVRCVGLSPDEIEKLKQG